MEDFTRKRAQTINSLNTESNLNIKSDTFDFGFTDSRMAKQFKYEHHPSLVSKKESDGFYQQKREKSGDLSVDQKTSRDQKTGNLWLKFDNNSNQNVWVPRRPDKRGGDEVAAIDLELLFRISENNRCGRGYFELNEPKRSLSREQKYTPEHTTNKPEPMSSIKECEMAKSLSMFSIVDLKDCDIAKKTI